MAESTRKVSYSLNGAEFEGVLALGDQTKGPRPCVLISHAWAGRTEQEVGFAKRLAARGYAALAIDLYGKGKTGATKEECQALMSPLIADRPALQARILRAVDVARDLPEADARKIAAMGFCFGGLCVLDLARTGADIRGVASFHGLFNPPGNTKGNTIRAKVIAFHGWDDPMVPPEDVVALGRELTDAGADWRIHAHGGAMHAFMNTEANDPGFGTVYNKKAADRSWSAFLAFLDECFA